MEYTSKIKNRLILKNNIDKYYFIKKITSN